MDARVRGLRLMAAALPLGGRLRGKLRFETAPEGWATYFLSAEDRVWREKQGLGFEWIGDGLEKGVHIEGEVGQLLSFTAEIDGGNVALWVGEKPWRGKPLGMRDLLADWVWPPAASQASLRLWLRDEVTEPVAAAPNPETLRRLEALGYVRP
jgi:hypothetical protein